MISELQKEDLNEDYSQAIWVSKLELSKYKEGDEIEVLYEGSEDSYPALVTAKKITKLE